MTDLEKYDAELDATADALRDRVKQCLGSRFDAGNVDWQVEVWRSHREPGRKSMRHLSIGEVIVHRGRVDSKGGVFEETPLSVEECWGEFVYVARQLAMAAGLLPERLHVVVADDYPQIVGAYLDETRARHDLEGLRVDNQDVSYTIEVTQFDAELSELGEAETINGNW